MRYLLKLFRLSLKFIIDTRIPSNLQERRSVRPPVFTFHGPTNDSACLAARVSGGFKSLWRPDEGCHIQKRG